MRSKQGLELIYNKVKHISIDLLLYCRSGIDALSVMQVLRGDASSFLVI